jgi:SET domain-containing protein
VVLPKQILPEATFSDRFRVLLCILLLMGRTYRKLASQPGRTRSSQSRMKEALEWIDMRRSRIHGRGAFARRDIPAGTRLIEYVGLPVSKKKAVELTQKQNRYLFALDSTSDLDGKVSWNPARLINHSCEPNCEADLDESNRIWIFSTRQIARGEELTFNYGYSLEDFRNFPCRCGAPSCAGYMVAEELIPVVRSMLAR